jgi:hypothetical protein
MKTSEQIDQLVGAIAKARPYFDPILKTEDNPFYKSKYADLATYINAVALPLAEEGVILSGGPEPFDDAYLLVTTRACHKSGQWMECGMLIRRQDKPQEMGSGITYARRYTLGALLGLASDDDDGNAASQLETKASRQATQPKSAREPDEQHPTTDQVSSLVELAFAAGSDMPTFGRFMRELMALPEETRITKKYLRDAMTMAQYDMAFKYYGDRLRDQVETDVRDFPAPNGHSEPQVESPTAEAIPPLDHSGSSNGEPNRSIALASDDAVSALASYAVKHGLSEVFQETMRRWPDGISQSAFDGLKRNLEWRCRKASERELEGA